MRTKILLAFAILWPLATWAADPLDIKPGLWETSASMSGASGAPVAPQIPEAALARMTPQQRAQMEAMMKGRGAGGPLATVKSCVTKESLNAGALGQTDKACTSKVISSSSSKQVLHLDCTRGNAKSSGDMTIERVDAENIKGAMAMKASEGGQGADVNMSFTMKWLAADCGDVKPAGAK